MSWATVAQKAKSTTQSAVEPKRVVFSVDHTNDNSNSKSIVKSDFSGLAATHQVGTTVPAFQKGLLVLDANAFIKGMDNLASLADAFVTTSQVLLEVRDRAARELLERFPHSLQVLEPSKESLTAIVSIATKTGDLGAMSRTDIRLCALALDCCKLSGSLLPSIKPEAVRINPERNHQTENVAPFRTNNTDRSLRGKESEGDSLQWHQIGTSNTDQSAGYNLYHNDEAEWEEEEVEENEEEEEEGWITPENIHQCNASGERGSGERFDGGVACATSDYAMQNTLLHAGVPIVGMQGMRIRELRHWLLRCTSCFSITTDTTRQFCAACGSGNTLRRVQYVLSSDGERQLFINFRKTISKRGTVYNLPKPRGGKCGTNRCLVLREDQLAHVIRGTSSTKLKEKYVTRSGNNDDDDLAAFGEAPKQRKRDLNQPRMHSSYHKYNMNEKKKVRASRRK